MFRSDVKVPEILPRDCDFLIQLVRELREEREANRRQFELIEHKLQEVLRRLCGPRSERLNPDQLDLIFAEMQRFSVPEESDQQEVPPEPPQPTKATRRGHGRRKLPKDLPRRRVVIQHNDGGQCQRCHGSTMKVIGEVVSEKLEYEPAQLFVIEEVRLKYACTDCEEYVMTAPKPLEVIPKCLAGPGLLAHVLTSKYADHLPLYRQEGILARMGVQLKRSTLCGWVMACADRFTPVVDFMTQDIIQSFAIHTDDTALPILDPQLGATRRGRLWVYIGDQHHPQVVFDYTPTRQRDGPAHFLKDFSGYLQADAYAGYDGIYATGKVKEVACWAHARRKFYELTLSNATGAHMTALAFIKQLYQIESRGRSMTTGQRQKLRQKHALPVLLAFKEWLNEQLDLIRPKSPMAQAMGYVMRQWEALNRYTEHGDLNIDNNLSERTLRSVAIGRKNWLFAGSDAAAQRGAVIFSLIASCKLHGVDPYAYLRFLLERLPIHPADRIGELTPLAWAQARASEQQAA